MRNVRNWDSVILLLVVMLFGSPLAVARSWEPAGPGKDLADPRWGSVVSTAQIVFMAPIGPEPVPGSASPSAWELVVMNLDGSGRQQVTGNEEQEFLPHFSPDGTRLVYTRFTSGGYGVEGSTSRVTVYDFATGSTRDLTDTGKDSYPVWSPDGSRIAFLSTRANAPQPGRHALWVMNADGSDAREINHPSGDMLDFEWGDIAWSSQDWILFVVAENNANNTCFKTRLDKIRPDGTQRTRVTDGGPNCTPPGMEQNGDADPGFSADGATIYTSRGFPSSPPGIPGATIRKLYAVSSDAWYPHKPERDLSLASAPDCIEGVPKGSPDGTRILLFRACAGEPFGVTVTDTAGSYRTGIADGFGPDWNPALPASNNLFDVRRDGHGIDFVRVRDSLYALTFYTYDANGEPEWYQALGNMVNGVFVPFTDANGKSLMRYRYNAANAPPQQQVSALSGTVSLDFNNAASQAPCNDGRATEDALAIMTFSLGNDQNVRWCMQPIVAASARATPDFSGLWHAGSQDDGWGWSILNFRLNDQNGLAAILFYYDAAGNSTWAYVQQSPFANNAQYPAFHRRAYCRGCTAAPFNDQAAGWVNFNFTHPSAAPAANNRISFDLSPRNSVGGSFARTGSPLLLLTTPQGSGLLQPANGRIAFSALAQGGEQIFSIDAQVGSRLQLTTEGSVNKFPAWSADGAAIVFSSDRTGTVDLWMMRAGGEAQARIPIELPGSKLVPQLSPDGTTIVFAYVDPAVGHPEVWTISADGGNAQKLTSTPKATTGPTWSLLPHFSPDGRRIVYASTMSGSSQIWIMNADGSGQRQVTSGFGPQFPDANAPKWSPDGSRIAFWAGFETQYGEIWTMRADGTDARQLTDQPGTISSDNPAWSPDGTKLLFDTNRLRSPQIWMMNADGSDQHLLVDIGIGNTQFSWQPLGNN